MYKFFTIFFALLTLILAGCSSTSPDPQVTEEPQEVEKQLDSEHVKNTLEQEKRQQKRMEELLAEMDAAAATKEPKPEPESIPKPELSTAPPPPPPGAETRTKAGG